MKQSKWPAYFKKQIKPKLQVADFRLTFKHYDYNPNENDLKALMGIILLQQLFDLKDEELCEKVRADNTWQTVLNISSDSEIKTKFSLKTLWIIKDNFLKIEPDINSFLENKNEIINIFNPQLNKDGLERITILSNIYNMNRIISISRTIELFLVKIKCNYKERYSSIKESIKEKYNLSKGRPFFLDIKPSISKNQMKKTGKDLQYLINKFKSDPDIEIMLIFYKITKEFERCFRIIENEIEVKLYYEEYQDDGECVISTEGDKITRYIAGKKQPDPIIKRARKVYQMLNKDSNFPLEYDSINIDMIKEIEYADQKAVEGKYIYRGVSSYYKSLKDDPAEKIPIEEILNDNESRKIRSLLTYELDKEYNNKKMIVNEEFIRKVLHKSEIIALYIMEKEEKYIGN